MQTTTEPERTHTTTIKQIPGPVYTQLKAAAKRNRRSLNQEMIVCLERGLHTQLAGADPTLLDQLDRHTQRLRAAGVWLDEEQVVAQIRSDRERDDREFAVLWPDKAP
jgi:hypothetical protein